SRGLLSCRGSLLGTFRQREHHATTGVRQAAGGLSLLLCRRLLSVGALARSWRKGRVARSFAHPLALQRGSRLWDLSRGKRRTHAERYVSLVLLDVIVSRRELELLGRRFYHLRRVLRAAHRNSFAVQESPHLLRGLRIA